jgi:hypothetical protein
MTDYGKKHAIDGFQMKDSSSCGKQMLMLSQLQIIAL